MLPLCGVEGDKQEQRDNEGEGYSAPSPAPQLTVTPDQQQCRSENDDLWLMREQYLSLLVDVRMREKPLEALQEQRDALVRQLHEIYRGAPSTNYKAYKKAQEALQNLEDMTFSDAEIDKFLPREMRRGGTTSA